MIFSDARFIVLFLPLSLLVLYLFRITRSRFLVAIALVVVSLSFYLQWNPADLSVVACSILVNFFIANVLRASARVKIILCVTANVGYLFFLKYIVATGLFSSHSDTVNLFGALGLPLGISFMTFQQIGFVIDQAEGRDRETSFIRYLFFVLFFPHLVAGPLVPHRLLCGQIDRKPFLDFSATFFRVGMAYFTIGLVKKLVIAEPISLVNNDLFAATASLSTVEAVFNAILYSLRIYFDFSAYSDMATGIAYMMGIQFPRNFRSPYKSESIFEFWRNWHISLYRFFRQYLYQRLMRLNLFQRNVGWAIMLVMVLSALWHGVGWGFIIWGVGHGGLMLLGRWMSKRGIRIGGTGGWARGVRILGTFVLVTLLWIPFAINDLHYIALYFGRMFSFTASVSHLSLRTVGMMLIALVAVFALPNSHQVSMGNRNAWWLLPAALILGAFALPLALGREALPPPFIYFQF